MTPSPATKISKRESERVSPAAHVRGTRYDLTSDKKAKKSQEEDEGSSKVLAGAFPVVDLIGEQSGKKAEKKKLKGKKGSSNALAESLPKAADVLVAVKKVPRKLEKKKLKAQKKAEKKKLKKKLKEKKNSAKEAGQLLPHGRAD